jgi:hypothetical protein
MGKYRMGVIGSPEKIEKKEKKMYHSAMKFVGVISLVAIIIMISTFTAITIITPTTTFQAYAQENEGRAVSEIIPFSETLDTTPCENDELVQISGNVHLVGRLVEDETGAVVKFVGHVNYQDAKGVGLTTGNDYVFTYAHNQILNGRLDGTGSFTFPTTSNLIAQGSSESAHHLLVHALVHVTINANGEVTAFIDNFSVECR